MLKTRFVETYTVSFRFAFAMAQHYASRPVTRIGSGSATAAALAQVSGLQSEFPAVVASIEVGETVLALPLDQLREKLEVATSDELRTIRAHIGLGKAGTKEANKALILDYVSKQSTSAVISKATSRRDEDVNDEFADLPMAPAFPGSETYIGTPPRAKFVAPSSFCFFYKPRRLEPVQH